MARCMDWWYARGGRVPWTPAFLGWILGTALQLQQPALWSASAYAACALGALAVLALGRRKAVWLLMVAGLLAFAACGLRAAVFAQQALTPSLQGRDLVLTGVVAAMPQRAEDVLRWRFAVEAAEGAEDAALVRVPPLVSLSWYAPRGAGDADDTAALPAVRAGERWRFTVRLKAPHGGRNPHGFDYELWLWEQGIQATGTVRTGKGMTAAQRLQGPSGHWLERAREHVRDAVFARVPDGQQAGVLAALAMGDQSAIDRADWDVFRATGVAHLMSISGLHITLFAWVARAALGWLWRRSSTLCLWLPAPSAALLGGIALAALYAAFSGWGVPAQRTVWMLSAVGLLRLAGLQWPWPAVWLMACAVVLAVDPWAWLQAGFWLSFVAVGVLFASDTGRSPTVPALAWWERLRAVAIASAGEQVLMTLALAPLSLLLFQQLSLVGLLANLLAIPWVTLVVTPLALLGVAVPLLWAGGALAVAVLARWLGWLAGWPGAVLEWPAPPFVLGVAALAGALLLALKLPWWLRAQGVPLVLPVLLWQPGTPAHGSFSLLAADIGQGNAVLVRTATHALLYDAGPRFSRESDAGQRVLVPLLRALGQRLDLLVLSHRDSDHTGGASAVLQTQPQARLLSSIEDAHALQALRPATRCEAGQHWEWDGVRFHVLHPAAQDYARAPKPNALSCVLRVDDGRHAVLLAGDIEAPQEAQLTARAGAAGLRADVLLAPHHGSKTSSSEAFVQAVQPRIVLVQAGYRNSFGHPAPVVLARYAAQGAQVVQTMRCGAAQWHSQDSQRVLCERAQARRYWQHAPP
jgi:competence protein ComEC